MTQVKHIPVVEYDSRRKVYVVTARLDGSWEDVVFSTLKDARAFAEEVAA